MLKMDQVIGESFPELHDFFEKYPRETKAALKQRFKDYCEWRAEGDDFDEGMTSQEKWEEYIDWQRDEPFDAIEAIGWEIVRRRKIKAAIVDVNIEDRNTGPNEYEWVLRIYSIIPETKEDLIEMLELMDVELPEVVAEVLVRKKCEADHQ